jgi:PAS domain S-box-containing protein
VVERLGPEGFGGSVDVALPVSDGSTWFGARSGLFHYAGGRLEQVGVEGGLTSSVRDLLTDSTGDLWIATYGAGIFRRRGSDLVRLSAADGLCENVVSRVIPDERGYLWLNGNRGVSRVELADLRAAADGGAQPLRCDLFDTGEGNGWAGVRDRSGALWFPTVNGVATLDPGRLRERVPPIVRVRGATVDELPLTAGARVTPERGDLSVEYSAVELATGYPLQFRRRLVGYDDSWALGGSERSARYGHLPPGDYRFEVQARGERGPWSQVASYSFSLAPRIGQRPEFWGFVAVLGCLAMWRVVRLQSEARERRSTLRQAEISERQREALALSEGRLRLILEASAEGILGLDADARLTFVNPSASVMLGRPVADLVGRPFKEVLRHTPDEVRSWLDGDPILAAVAAGRSLRREGDLFWDASGRAFPVAFALEDRKSVV